MFQPVQVAFGAFLQDAYRQLVPTTAPLQEYVQRGFARAAAWAPGRLVDQAGELLESWQRKDAGHEATTTPFALPVLIVALAKGFEPVRRDFGIQHADPIHVMFPADPKERYFKVRLLAGDLRAQIAIFAADAPTAQSLAAQLLLYLDSPAQRRFFARYPFAGLIHHYPVQLTLPDAPAIAVETGQSNMTALAIDLTLTPTVPLFMAPGIDEPHDGKGVPGTDDPAGYPLVAVVGHEEQGQ